MYLCSVYSFCHFLDQKEAAPCESNEYRFHVHTYICLYVCMCVMYVRVFVCTSLFNMHQLFTLIGFCKLLIWLNVVVFAAAARALPTARISQSWQSFSTYYILIVFLFE